MAGTLDDILQLELKQLNENSKSMTSDIKQIKEILNAQYSYVVDTAENKEAFARTEKQLSEQRAEARENFIQEENKKNQEETQKKLDELTQTTKQSQKNLGDNGKTANIYLERLMRMTQDNMEMQRKKKDESLWGQTFGQLGKNIDALGKQQYGRKSDFTEFAFKNTAQIVSGIKGVITDSIGVGKKVASVFGKGSEGRQKSIERDTTAINRLQMQKQTREQEASRLQAAGQLEKAEKLRNSIGLLDDEIDKTAKSLSKTTSKEHLHQLKKSDKEYKKIDESDQKMMMSQIADKMFTSITGRRLLDNESKSHSNLLNNHESLVNNQQKNTNSEILTINKRENESDLDNLQETNVSLLINTPIASSGEPSTFGQYIAGIYEKLSGIEYEIKNKTTSTNEDTQNEKKEGGGFLSSLLTMGGLTALLAGGGAMAGSGLIGKATGWLGNMFGGQDEETAKESEEATSDNVHSVGEHMATTGGLSLAKMGSYISKYGGKILGKTALEGAGKSVLKKIPGVGIAAGLGFGAERILKEGDWLGGLGEATSGLASTIPFIGTGASVGIDAMLAARDIKRGITGESAKARKEHEVDESGGFGLRKDQGILAATGIGNISGAWSRVKSAYGLAKEGEWGGAAKQYGAGLLEGIPLVGAAAANWLGGDPNKNDESQSQQPSQQHIKPQSDIGPQSSVIAPEQQQVAMLSASTSEKNEERQLAGYQIQAQLIADAIAKRNMQSDVRQEMMIPVRENQGFFTNLFT